MTGKKIREKKIRENVEILPAGTHEKIPAPSIAGFRKTILSYYAENGRDLPWRHTTDPYRILVSEIMLQQTQVDRVVKKYPEFIQSFPTCHDLALAPLAEVLAVWRGMGYNRRAIALQECAGEIVRNHAGRVPEGIEELEQLPGIGAATARSIAVFAFNRPVVFIETNIRRVFIHYFFNGKTGIRDQDILPLVKEALDHQNPRVWYSALMDYGTMLKTKVENPNRRSAHYSRQTAFSGSDRQIRGALLARLIRTPDLDEDTLITEIAREEPDRVRRIIDRLISERFLERAGSRIRIRNS